MHFVGEFAGRKNIRSHQDIFSPVSGEKIGVKGTIWLVLERGMAPDWAVEEATKRFRFASRPTPGSIGGADIPVSAWCVYIDTEEWAQRNHHDDEIRLKAEAVLSSDPDMMEVFPPVLRPPWPKYDELTVVGRRTFEMVAAQHLATAAEIGVPIEDLITYETAKLNREPLIEAYMKALNEGVEPESASYLVEA